jgi:hypothetical protein
VRAHAFLCVIAIGCGRSQSGHPDAIVSITDAIAPSDSDGCGECNPVDQLGCNAGQTCKEIHVAYPSGCVGCSLTTTVPLGSACTITGPYDDCAAGGFCVDGICRQSCGSGNTKCDEGYCPNYHDFTVCTLPCDPFAAVNTCAQGESCYGAGGMATPGCAPTGSALEGEHCWYAQDCVPGDTCVFYNNVLACVQLCTLDGSHPCASPQATCMPILDNATYGACVVN